MVRHSKGSMSRTSFRTIHESSQRYAPTLATIRGLFSEKKLQSYDKFEISIYHWVMELIRLGLRMTVQFNATWRNSTCVNFCGFFGPLAVFWHVLIPSDQRCIFLITNRPCRYWTKDYCGTLMVLNNYASKTATLTSAVICREYVSPNHSIVKMVQKTQLFDETTP